MDDAPKVVLATTEVVDDGRTILSMRTTDGIDVFFELDDMALGCLYLTIGSTTEAALERGPRTYWRYLK